VFRINAEIDGQLNGLVKLGVMRLLQKLGSLAELVGTRLHFLARVFNVFA
jgi:hypothetical protein